MLVTLLAKQHNVSRDDRVAIVPGQSANDSSYRTFKLPAIVRLNHAIQSDETDDASAHALTLVYIDELLVGVFNNDRATPCDIAFPRQSLRRPLVFRRDFVSTGADTSQTSGWQTSEYIFPQLD